MKRVNSIDLTKGIAMIMILLVHYEQSFGLCKWFKYFRMGCPIFFVASGFGIMCLVEKRFNGSINSKNIWEFYLSRIKAIIPSWWLAFMIVFLVNSVLMKGFGRTLSFGTNRGGVSIVCNLLLLNGFFPFCNNNVMPGGWYIGATAILYALTPIILYMFRKYENKKILLTVSAVLSIIIWGILRFVFEESVSSGNFDYYFFAIHLPEYLLGFILYYNTMKQPRNQEFMKHYVPLGFATLIVAYCAFYMNGSFNIVLSSWLTALAAYCIIYHLISVESTTKLSGIGNLLVFIGKASLGIYLMQGFWVWSFISALKIVFSRIGINIISWFWFIVLFPLVAALCCFTGYLFNLFIKKMMCFMNMTCEKSTLFKKKL